MMTAHTALVIGIIATGMGILGLLLDKDREGTAVWHAIGCVGILTTLFSYTI